MILDQMTESKDGTLLYRATRDGFEGTAFHAKCDDKENTITIIKTNGDYVFGGYTAANWSSNSTEFKEDSKAFIFSLRRTGILCYYKFKVKYAKSAIVARPGSGPAFGNNDIDIMENSNIYDANCACLGYTYDYPPDNGDAQTFLAGSYTNFLTTEIEVYQINK